MAITTTARIRSLSGFRPYKVTGDTLGVGDGVAVSFYPREYPVFVSPFADTPQASEIVVYVDGVQVAVDSISETVVILDTPPAEGALVTADYWGHNLANTDVVTVRTEIEAEVFGRFVGMYSSAQLATSPLMQKIVAYLSAASITDGAYNQTGADTPGALAYPPDRLRRVAYNLLTEISAGIIKLVDDQMVEIPAVASIESWVNETTYGDKDRLFEVDPFDATSGTLDRTIDSDWRWGDAT